MTKEFTKTQVENYLTELYDNDDPVRHEMEVLAQERNFPIIGPLSGRHLYQLALMIGAKRVFELGSGFGYSALYFSRAVGEQGEVHCTELSGDNVQLAQKFLTRAGVWNRVTYYQEEATAALRRVGGEWDIIYNDINKDGYPETIELAYQNLRPGGLFITDNLFWNGNIFSGDDAPSTRGVIEFKQRIFVHPGFSTTIYQARDGLAVALKL